MYPISQYSLICLEPIVSTDFDWRNSTINYSHSFQSHLDFHYLFHSFSSLIFVLSLHTHSSDHFSYLKHKCTSAHKKDVQVPVCPLCSEPVPTPRGVSPDMTVGQHIDQYCKSNKTKIFTNRCSFRGCKKKELVPVHCGQCKMNFCLRHRHATDHECNPKAARSNLFA